MICYCCFQRLYKLTQPTIEWKPAIENTSTASTDQLAQPPSYVDAVNNKTSYENPAFDETAANTRF